jgi:hypothetical protein
MPRIPLVSEVSMTDAQRRVHDAMMSGPRRSPPVGPLAAAMHRPDLAACRTYGHWATCARIAITIRIRSRMALYEQLPPN